MRKRTLLLTGVIALPLLLLLAVRGIGGVGSRPAEAGATVLEGPANVELIGSSQTWSIVSKADFGGNRLLVVVERPGPEKKALEASFTCGTGVKLPGEQKLETHGADPTGPNELHREVWSATFPNKCISPLGHPGSKASVTLVPADPRNKLVIKEAHVENTSLRQVGAINVRQIGNSVNWKVTFKDPNKGYNRVELYVGRGTGGQKVRRAVFRCQSTHERVRGEPKRVDVNVNPDPTRPNHEVWSATFSRKCVGGVRARFFPVRCPDDAEAEDGGDRCGPRNRIVVKGGLALNTTRPRTGPANVTLKAKSETFKITSKANFAANRVEIDVGTGTGAPKVKSASFACQAADGTLGPKITVTTPKGFVVNATPSPGVTLDEVWSVNFPEKCMAAADPFNGVSGGSALVTLIPADPNNQLVIKKARVQNIPPPTDTPTPAQPTPHLTATPTGTQGGCVNVGNDIPFNHDFRTPTPGSIWDSWKCSPGNNVDWNRVDIYIENPGALQVPQVPKVKDVQFDCQSNRSKANAIIFKGFIKNAANPIEIWSGQDFKPRRGARTKNCHGGVSVFIQRAQANKPIIKKAVFTHIGAPKPTPPKLDSNGHCDPATAGANQWTCTPNDGVPPFNRIDIKVPSPTAGLQLADVQAVCADGTVGVVEVKGQKVVDVNGVATHHEVWSANFPYKCTGAVSVTLKPFPQRGTPVAGSTPPRIIGVVFSNPPKPAANGNCRDVIAPHTWACYPDNSVSQFTRVDISVGKAARGLPKVSAVRFLCSNPGQFADGQFKLQKPNGPETPSPLSAVWSVEFVQPCTGYVIVSFAIVDQCNNPVIKKVVFS